MGKTETGIYIYQFLLDIAASVAQLHKQHFML